MIDIAVIDLMYRDRFGDSIAWCMMYESIIPMIIECWKDFVLQASLHSMICVSWFQMGIIAFEHTAHTEQLTLIPQFWSLGSAAKTPYFPEMELVSNKSWTIPIFGFMLGISDVNSRSLGVGPSLHEDRPYSSDWRQHFIDALVVALSSVETPHMNFDVDVTEDKSKMKSMIRNFLFIVLERERKYQQNIAKVNAAMRPNETVCDRGRTRTPALSKESRNAM